MSRHCSDPNIARLLDQAKWVGLPAVVIGELCAGFTKGSKTTANHRELNEFLASPVVEILPVDRRVAELFGELTDELRRAGRPIPINDIWIAATRAHAAAPLLTWDRHFEFIPRTRTCAPGATTLS